MTIDYRYKLQTPRVTGRRQQKTICPHCGRKSFVRYVDTQNACQYVAKERTAPFRHHCHHIHHTLAVAVPHAAPQHRRLFLSRKGLLADIDFALHTEIYVFSGVKVANIFQYSHTFYRESEKVDKWTCGQE